MPTYRVTFHNKGTGETQSLLWNGPNKDYVIDDAARWNGIEVISIEEQEAK